jgi:hypothetical protein
LEPLLNPMDYSNNYRIMAIHTAVIVEVIVIVKIMTLNIKDKELH